MDVRLVANQVLARLRFGSRAQRTKRRVALAHRFLRGSGMEIGALHNPLPISAEMQVTYVDKLANVQLKHHYPEIPSDTLVQVDIVADAERLLSVPDESQDFVIASHLIEHCEDPIGALQTWIRVLRMHGEVLLAVPNKALTFDRCRPVTPWAHILRDWQDGPIWSREQHYLEWVCLVENVADSEAHGRALDLMKSRYSIHFHVWSSSTFKQFLFLSVDLLDDAFTILEFVPNGDETIALLQKH